MSTRWFIFLSILCVTAFRFYIFDLLVTNNSPILPKFPVDSVSVSNFSYFDSNSSVTGNWNAQFSIYNPNNWMTISYESFSFTHPGSIPRPEFLPSTSPGLARRLSMLRSPPETITWTAHPAQSLSM